MITLALLTGLMAIVIGLGDHSWPSWQWRLFLYTWGAAMALAAAYVLPIVIGEVMGG